MLRKKKDVTSHPLKKKFLNAGVSIIEAIVSIFIIGLILSIFSSSLISFGVNQSNKNKALAYNFAEAELEDLKNYPFDSLTERTDAAFVGLAYNFGQQKIVSDAGALSPPQVQSVAPAPSMIGGNVSSIALLPEDYYTDFTFSAYFKILSSSAADWQTGIVFRYQDIENYYYFSITQNTLKLEKTAAGVTTTLYSGSQTFVFGTWYNLKVAAAGNSLKVYLNDILKTEQSDGTFASGCLGAVGKNSVYYYLDNFHLESAVQNKDWFFDAGTVNAFPEGFLKLNPTDLPGTSGKLTIENYGSAEIKKIIIKVVWQERGANQEVQLSTLRSKVYE